MQRYQVVVNGNTYTVTVKSLIGNTAIVDVDGWEFQVAIAEGEGRTEFTPLVAAATRESMGPKPSPSLPPVNKPTPPPTNSAGRRSTALEELGPKKAGMQQISGAGVVMAHLPGQIIDIIVKVGDKVSRGDVVCKMEAMKMVNEVKASIDGVVKEILVQEQQNVLENQPLMIIE